MVSQKVVIPTKAGIHADFNYLKRLDSHLHWNDINICFLTFYEFIKDDKPVKSKVS